MFPVIEQFVLFFFKSTFRVYFSEETANFSEKSELFFVYFEIISGKFSKNTPLERRFLHDNFKWPTKNEQKNRKKNEQKIERMEGTRVLWGRGAVDITTA